MIYFKTQYKKKIFFILFVLLISCWNVNANTITRNLTLGVSRIKDSGVVSNSDTYNLTLPPNASSISIDIENTSSVGNIVYTISFSTLSWEPSSGTQTLTCSKAIYNIGGMLPPNSTFTQTLTPSGTTDIYTCPLPTSDRIQFSIISSSTNVTMAIYAIVSSNGLSVQNPNNVSVSTLTSSLNNSGSIAEKGQRTSVTSSPAVSLQASASQAASGSTLIRNVADCISYSAGAIVAPVATTVTINLRNGASGLGTILWSKTVTIPATTGVHINGDFCGLNLIGSGNTAMTLEFSTLLANESESVTLTTYQVQ